MMIGGPKAQVDLLDPIFQCLAPGIGTVERTKRRDLGPRVEGRTWLCPLRPRGVGTLYQDDPQRHRIWHDAGLCRGLRHPARAGQSGARYQLRPQSQRHCRSLAARKRHLVVAARPDLDRAGRGPDPVQILRARGRQRRGPLDDRRGDGGSGAGRRPRGAICSPATAAGSRKATPTSCSARCASASVGMWRCHNKRSSLRI